MRPKGAHVGLKGHMGGLEELIRGLKGYMGGLKGHMGGLNGLLGGHLGHMGGLMVEIENLCHSFFSCGFYLSTFCAITPLILGRF